MEDKYKVTASKIQGYDICINGEIDFKIVESEGKDIKVDYIPIKKYSESESKKIITEVLELVIERIKSDD